MTIAGEIIIDSRKSTHYLLVWKAESDKSAFLAELGYSSTNWDELEQDIRQLIRTGEAVYSRPASFDGDLYKISGRLRTFGVITIWLYSDAPSVWRFVT